MQQYPQQPKKVSDKIIANTFYNVLGRIWFVAIGLLLTPYIIGRVGVERFAVWALVGVITGYFGLLDFGVGSSFVKYISEFEAKKDYAAINRLVNTGFAFYAVFGMLVVAASFFLIGPLMEFLKIPAALRPEARFVFLLGIAVFCGSDAMGPFLSVQAGLQRMDISNKIAMAMSAVTVCGTLFFLERGFGLAGLMLTNAIVFVFSAIIGIGVAHRLLPQLSFDPLSGDWKTFKRIFSFGFKVQITRISGTVASQTDKILITYFLTIGLVTVYQLGSSVVAYAMTVPALLVSALVPAFSEIYARQEHKKLVEAYLQSTKYLACITAPLFLFVAVNADRIMKIWMGTGFAPSATIIQILCAAFLLNTVARLSSALAMAVERPGYMMKGSLFTIFSNIIVSIILIKVLGFSGVAWGTVIAVNAGTIYFLYRLHRDLAITGRAYLAVTGSFVLACVPAAAAVVLINIGADRLWGARGRLFDLCIFSVEAILFASVYAQALVRARLFSEHDRAFLKEKFPAGYAVMSVLFASRKF